MPSKSQLRAQFAAITNTSDQVAGSYLEKNHWDLNRATDAFLSEPTKHPSPPKALVALYEHYCDGSNADVISIDGTLQYLADMALDPEDVRCLVLAHVLSSPETGVFRRKDFLEYWARVGALSAAEMAAHVSEQSAVTFSDPAAFESLYNYCFDFVRGSDTRIKTIASDEAVAYWQLLFAQRPELGAVQARLGQWYEFIGSVERGVSKDLWSMFLRFVQAVIIPDPDHFGGYDEMSSWPSLVDEYVEWLREKGLLDSQV